MGSTITRTLTLLLITALGTWYCVAQAQPPAKPTLAPKLEVKNSQLLDVIKARQQKLLLVTPEPHAISIPAGRACEPNDPQRDRDRHASNPHAGYAVNVFITEAGRDMMTTGNGVYPIGSTILKEKMQTLGAVNPDAGNAPNNRANNAPQRTHYSTALYTGMLKREAGYNHNGGDWEYFVVSGDAKKLLARGKIDSCIDCHEAYKATDYVTRAYMPVGK